MGNHERWIDIAIPYPIEQRLQVPRGMRLAHFQRESLGKRSAHWYFVDEASIHTRDRYRPAFPARHDRLAKHPRTVLLKKHRLLGAIVGVLEPAAVRFHSHRVDARI